MVWQALPWAVARISPPGDTVPQSGPPPNHPAVAPRVYRLPGVLSKYPDVGCYRFCHTTSGYFGMSPGSVYTRGDLGRWVGGWSLCGTDGRSGRERSKWSQPDVQILQRSRI